MVRDEKNSFKEWNQANCFKNWTRKCEEEFHENRSEVERNADSGGTFA